MAPYTFEVRWKAGADHKVPDALSRSPNFEDPNPADGTDAEVAAAPQDFHAAGPSQSIRRNDSVKASTPRAAMMTVLQEVDEEPTGIMEKVKVGSHEIFWSRPHHEIVRQAVQRRNNEGMRQRDMTRDIKILSGDTIKNI